MNPDTAFLMDPDAAKLAEAVRRLARWVGIGIADNLFENRCVAPSAAVYDLTFAEHVLKEYEDSRKEGR